MIENEVKSLSSLVEETEEAKEVARQLKLFFMKEIQRVRDSYPDHFPDLPIPAIPTENG